MKVVNLTPHDIVVRLAKKDLIYPASGKSARVAINATEQDPLVVDGDKIPIVVNNYGSVDAPAPEDGTIYLVSLQALEACKRPDMLAPDTSPAGVVRDPSGRVVAVRRLIKALTA